MSSTNTRKTRAEAPEARATLYNYRQAPRKVRLVADLICGKRAGDALSLLSFLPKRASEPIKKLVESAIANAKLASIEKPEALLITDIRVDKATTITRSMPRARGRATPIRKHGSHVTLILRSEISAR